LNEGYSAPPPELHAVGEQNNPQYVNPKGMLKSPAFSQAVIVNNPAKTIC
jgi:hypothetical protein